MGADGAVACLVLVAMRRGRGSVPSSFATVGGRECTAMKTAGTCILGPTVTVGEISRPGMRPTPQGACPLPAATGNHTSVNSSGYTVGVVHIYEWTAMT
jgi:hypothetical protein